MPPKVSDPMLNARRYVDKQSGLVTQRQQTKALDRLKRSIPIPDVEDATVVWVGEGKSLANALAKNPGRHLKLQPGASYQVDALTLTGASYDGTIIEGGPGTVLLSPANPTGDVILLQSVNNVQIRNLTIQVGSGTATSTSVGVHITGACDGCVVENVIADGFGVPIKVDGSAHGTAASTVLAIEVGSQATSGTFLLGGVSPLSLGQTIYTGTIARNASAATLETALEAIYGAGNVDVTGGGAPGTPYVVTFQSALADLDIPLPIAVPTALAPANTTPVLISVTTRGGGPWVTNLSLRRLSCNESPTNWGIQLAYCDGATLDDCSASRNWLDGLKTFKFADNVSAFGCHFDDNGQGARQDAAVYAGDGCDTFSSGHRMRFVACTFNRNAGSGFQGKNTDSAGTTGGGVISGYGTTGWGINKGLEFVACEMRWNSVGGLFLTIVSATGSYAIRDVAVLGGDYSDNGRSGVFLDSVRNASLTGVKARRNGESGFFVHSRSSYIEIDNCQAHANKLYGAFIDGDHIQLRGGIYLGVDTEGLVVETDLSALTAVTTTNILVGTNASHVLIDRPDDQYTTGGRSIEVTAGATEPITIHHRRLASGLVVGVSTIYGGPGSTATDNSGVAWIKIEGVANAVGVWKRVGRPSVVSKSAAYTAIGSDDIILVTAGATDKTITLPAAATMAGVILTVKRMDAAAGNVIVDGNASETIDGATTKTLGAQYSAITIVGNGTNWSILNQLGTVT